MKSDARCASDHDWRETQPQTMAPDRSRPEPVHRSLDHVIGVRIPASQPITIRKRTTDKPPRRSSTAFEGPRSSDAIAITRKHHFSANSPDSSTRRYRRRGVEYRLSGCPLLRHPSRGRRLGLSRLHRCSGIFWGPGPGIRSTLRRHSIPIISKLEPVACRFLALHSEHAREESPCSTSGVTSLSS